VTRSPVPHGSWSSPITADLVARGMSAGQIAAPSCLGFQGEELWWIEPRPQEDGRSARHRFVSGARVSPDGSRAVWLAGDHPHMPWDAAELRIAAG
jgi:hypothetical protein